MHGREVNDGAVEFCRSRVALHRGLLDYNHGPLQFPDRFGRPLASSLRALRQLGLHADLVRPVVQREQCRHALDFDVAPT